MIEKDIVNFHKCLLQIEKDINITSEKREAKEEDICIIYHFEDIKIIIDNVLVQGKHKNKYMNIIQEYFDYLEI